jgi:hypothetical protein
MYNAIIVSLKNVRPHPNADRLQLANVFGNTVVVGLDAKEGQQGVYFDEGGQLSEQFTSANNLYRPKFANKNSDPEKSGMFEENRRVRAISLRGVKSVGFWMPIECLNFLGLTDFPEEGFEFTALNGTDICNKYITKATRNRGSSVPGGKRAERDNKMFLRHFDTPQLGRVVSFLSLGDRVVITEKLHGTSQRVGLFKQEFERKWWHKLLGVKKMPVWKYIIGTRRVQLSEEKLNTGFYDGAFRQAAAAEFLGNLHKGETVYYEVVGFHGPSSPIMPKVDNTKLKGHLSKEEYERFIKIYGEETEFTYGCKDGEFKNFVYRITQVNEDGHAIDLSWDALKKRCSDMGWSHVPEIQNNYLFLEADYDFIEQMDKFAELPSTLASHLSEGVCVRMENYPTPFVAKHKSFNFKVVEGIIKDTGASDMEESS